MSGIECLAPERLGPILERKRNPDASPRGLPRFPLDTLLITILEKANEFVPSAAGSILLDDPILKLEGGSARKDLIFVCCFGPSASALIGERIPIETGIAGAVYRTGISSITNDAYGSGEFAVEFDRKSGYVTRSILCVAIRIGRSICGVIELVNRQGRDGYTDGEKELLEIFAQYISSTIQNAVDAKRIGTIVRADDLTGLHNDRYLHERLPLEVERSLTVRSPLSVVFLDLDRFKEINDTHGHLAGSATLAEFGHLLLEAVGREDATLVRYGGDEFVVLLPGTGADAALLVAEEIRARTERHVFLDGRWGDEEPLHLGGIISASIGVSTLSSAEVAPPPGRALSRIAMDLLQTADHAMYTSKSRGKNVVTVEPFVLPPR